MDLLDRFAAAWNAHDVETLVDCMTDDGVFYGSVGPQPDGASSRGISALRAGFSAVWEMFPDAAWNDINHILAGDRAVTEWRFTGTRSDGTSVDVRGTDIFTLRGGKIAVKDTFRKQIS
ncbi:MAG: nuclear transport factor 2 family protein [Pseudomonadota bacterium]